MPTFSLYGPLNFRQLLADIADTTPAEMNVFDPDTLGTDDPQAIFAEIELDNGLQMTFSSFSAGTYISVIQSEEDPSNDYEVATIARLPQMSLNDLADLQSYFDGTIFFDDGSPSFYTYLLYSSNNEAVIQGFDLTEFLLGVGTLQGRGGDDVIFLDEGGVPPGVASSGRATGGTGNDIIVVDVDKAFIAGGAGDDVLTFVKGHANAKGGAGADSFKFLSNLEGDDASVKARVRDFDPTADTMVFDTAIHPIVEFEDEPDVTGPDLTELTFAELFGAGDLSNLDDFTADGVTFTFTETGRGNSIITRNGTDSSGSTFDERIILRDVSLDEIDRADISVYTDPTLFGV